MHSICCVNSSHEIVSYNDKISSIPTDNTCEVISTTSLYRDSENSSINLPSNLVKENNDHAHSISDSSFQTSVGSGFESQPVSIEGPVVVDMLHDISSDVHENSENDVTSMIASISNDAISDTHANSEISMRLNVSIVNDSSILTHVNYDLDMSNDVNT